MAKEKITIDDLAAMVARGFEEVREQFKLSDEQISSSEERVKGVVKGELRSLDGKINSVNGAMVSEFIKIHNRFDELSLQIHKETERSKQDDQILFIDVDNIKKEIDHFKQTLKKSGVKMPSSKGA